ncbi:MAG TPA: P-loop NTPase [Thermoanaerobaculia bacterium]|nr:P-loop NTPase [Thermoanaerobaculia bacterium]
MKTYSDIVGDGGSRVVEQVVAQRQAIDEALAGVGRLVAVGSGKGGVGKSTLTLGLARALAGRGRRVAILDADFNGPSQARMAGLEGRPWLPGGRGLSLPRRTDGIGVVSVGSLLPDGHELRFDTVSKGEQHTWRGTREFATLAQILATVEWGELDHLLLDLPPGAERTVQFAEFLPGSTSFVLVTIPSELAHGVVARSLTALAGTGAPLAGYVENMAGYWCRDCGEVKPLFPQAAAPLDAPCLGRVPFDPELAALCDAGWPEAAVPATSAALAAVAAVAENLERALAAAPSRSASPATEEVP